MGVKIEDLTPGDEITSDEIAAFEDEVKKFGDQEFVINAADLAEDGAEQGQEASAEADEVVVSIGDEPPPEEEKESAPEWVRELRKNHREAQKRIRELEAQVSSPAKESTPQLGKKPTLEDHDYDADKFEQALTDWHDRKRKIEKAKEEAEEQEKAQAKAWQEKLDGYAKSKTALKVKDFDDAESAVQESFDVTQQGIVLQGSENPALLIYALGKNQAKAKELSAIKDPVKFAFAIAKLETQLKVTNKKTPPPPEKVVTGTGRVSGSSDVTLERLREEAARTGDMSKVVAYKRSKRAA